MDTPQFVDGQFVNGTLLNDATAGFMANFQAIGSELHTPGLLATTALSITPSNLVLTISAPSPFAVLFGSGELVGAHGTVNGADTSTYTLNLASLVPASGSQTVYVLAELETIGENEIVVVGPPDGHPDYDPTFNPFQFYTTERDSLSIIAGTTPADNVTTFELCRVTLSVGQSSIQPNQIITTYRQYASAVLNPTGVTPGTYSNASVTVAADGRITAVSSAVGFLPGEIKIWPSANLPSGFLWCNGAAVSRTTYANLFAEISTTFGAGDGSTTFNLPDFRCRVPVGMDNMGGAGVLGLVTAAGCGVNAATLGATGGNQSLQAHGHTVSDPTHAHGVYDPTHAHSVYDPTHAHGVADGGHAHTEQYFESAFGNTPGPGAAGTGSTVGNSGLGTGVSGSGIGIYAAGTGIGIYGAYTGIGIYAAGTGISIVAAGSGGSQNVQPTIVVPYIIYAG